MSAERQLARAQAALRAGDRVRARQLLGGLLRQDPTMVEGWLLLSRAMSTQAASQWCLRCAAKFIPIDDGDASSASAHPESAEGDPASSGEVELARPARDHSSAPPDPRKTPAIERPSQASHRLAEAWEALDGDGLGQNSELASVSRALEARRGKTTRKRGAPRGSAAERETLASVPQAERRETDDRPPANPTPDLGTSSTAWRAVYLEPARAFLEKEEKDSHGHPPTEEEPGGVLAGLSGLAGRALNALRKRITRVERRARSVAQLVLFVVGVLLLCNGASLLYPRVIPSLCGDPWLAEAAPALGAQGEAKPPSTPITKVLAPSAPRVSQSQSLQREADPSTAQTTSSASPAVGQNANPTPVPQAPEAPQASLASSDLPETRSKPDVIVNKAVPTRVIIPALGLDAPVVPVTSTIREIQGRQVRSWDVPGAGAAGWHIESSPLGVVGNTVLNGHNTTEGEVFRDLHQLQPGDEVIVLSGNEQHTYTVATTAVFREAGAPLERRLEHARLLASTEDRRLTLITCHPYGSTLNRLVVTCFPRGDQTQRGYVRD